MGVHQKNQICKEGGSQKTIQKEDCLKRGAWTIFRFKEGFTRKKGGGVFVVGEDHTPMHTMLMSITETRNNNYPKTWLWLASCPYFVFISSKTGKSVDKLFFKKRFW